LSFYEKYIDRLIDNRITAYMLSAIEMDTFHSSTDDDTIKYSVIALANLSCKKRFMNDRLGPLENDRGTASTLGEKSAGGSIEGHTNDTAQMSKVDRGKIKPLIHLLDSAKSGQINII
jgi:hypothetical protein